MKCSRENMVLRVHSLISTRKLAAFSDFSQFCWSFYMENKIVFSLIQFAEYSFPKPVSFKLLKVSFFLFTEAPVHPIHGFLRSNIAEEFHSPSTEASSGHNIFHLHIHITYNVCVGGIIFIHIFYIFCLYIADLSVYAYIHIYMCFCMRLFVENRKESRTQCSLKREDFDISWFLCLNFDRR